MLEHAVTQRFRSLYAGLAFALAECLLGTAARAAEARRASTPEVSRPTAFRLGCSLSEPVCVHAAGDKRVPVSVAAGALEVAERTLRFLRGNDLALPIEDGALGGGPEFDVYLSSEVTSSRAHDDPASLIGANDSASAFGLVTTAHRGCELASDVARAVAQAALIGLDPGADGATLGIGSSQLAAVVAPCFRVEAAALDQFQRAPERALVEATPSTFAGAALWADYLEETYGKGGPPRLWTEFVALEGQRTPATSFVWISEPDVYDILRRLLHGLGSSLDEAGLGFAVARAFVGSRSDGNRLADTERYGDLGRVRFDWSVPITSLPRRLRTRPIEATGATFGWLDTAGAVDTDGLVLVAECEHTYAVRWALVTVDGEGKELGRHTAGRWGDDTVQISLSSLKDVAGVLVVGSVAGHDDRELPFDPDEGSVATAVCEVTLRRD